MNRRRSKRVLQFQNHGFDVFEVIGIDSDGGSTSLELWAEAFPDPSKSPTYYTRVFSIAGFAAITAATTFAHPWIRSFAHIFKLVIDTGELDDEEVSLV